ncbi:MAG: DUF3016 domain-containing protein [Rhodocyclaceae bacterium]
MKRSVLGLIAAAGATVAVAAGQVEVRFNDPQNYVDGDPRGGAPTRSVLNAFERYLVSAGSARLSGAQTLSIVVLDIDLAGEINPLRPQGVRVMGAVTPPRIKLKYQISENGRVFAEGEELVTNPDYLTDAASRTDGDPLFYEKRMLDAWFDRRIGTSAKE